MMSDRLGVFDETAAIGGIIDAELLIHVFRKNRERNSIINRNF